MRTPGEEPGSLDFSPDPGLSQGLTCEHHEPQFLHLSAKLAAFPELTQRPDVRPRGNVLDTVRGAPGQGSPGGWCVGTRTGSPGLSSALS